MILLTLSRFDPATRQILQRLEEINSWLKNGDRKFDHITTLLESGSGTGAELSSLTQINSNGFANSIPADTPTVHSLSPTYEHANRTTKLEYPKSPLSSITCESLLRWPIFKDVIPSEEREIQSFLLDSDRDFDAEPSPEPSRGANLHRPLSANRGVQDDDVVPLCKRFISNVQSRSPILDEEVLLSYAKEVSEHGLQWDSKSCLVVS